MLTSLNNLFDQALKNQYITGILTLGLILYASMARPGLPEGLVTLFDHGGFRFMFCALIVYVASKNIRVALIVALAFVVTMSVLNEQKIAEGFTDGLRDMGAGDAESLVKQIAGYDADAAATDPEYLASQVGDGDSELEELNQLEEYSNDS